MGDILMVGERFGDSDLETSADLDAFHDTEAMTGGPGVPARIRSKSWDGVIIDQDSVNRPGVVEALRDVSPKYGVVVRTNNGVRPELDVEGVDVDYAPEGPAGKEAVRDYFLRREGE